MTALRAGYLQLCEDKKGPAGMCLAVLYDWRPATKSHDIAADIYARDRETVLQSPGRGTWRLGLFNDRHEKMISVWPQYFAMNKGVYTLSWTHWDPVKRMWTSADTTQLVNAAAEGIFEGESWAWEV